MMRRIRETRKYSSSAYIHSIKVCEAKPTYYKELSKGTSTTAAVC